VESYLKNSHKWSWTLENSTRINSCLSHQTFLNSWFNTKSYFYPQLQTRPRKSILAKISETGTKTSGISLANHSIKNHLIPSYREKVLTVLVKLCPKTHNQNPAEYTKLQMCFPNPLLARIIQSLCLNWRELNDFGWLERNESEGRWRKKREWRGICFEVREQEGGSEGESEVSAFYKILPKITILPFVTISSLTCSTDTEVCLEFNGMLQIKIRGEK